MHFVISWDIKAEKPRWDDINTALKEGLRGYSWVRPLTTFYIVKVGSQADWDAIRQRQVEAAKRFPGVVNFVMSPLMQGGAYHGWLPKDLWPKIRERVE